MADHIIAVQCVDTSDQFVMVTLDRNSKRLVEVSRSLTEEAARLYLQKLGKTGDEIDTMIVAACCGLRRT